MSEGTHFVGQGCRSMKKCDGIATPFGGAALPDSSDLTAGAPS